MILKILNLIKLLLRHTILITCEYRSFLHLNAKHLFGNRELLEYLRDTLGFELKDFKKHGLFTTLNNLNKSFNKHHNFSNVNEFIEIMSNINDK